MLKDMKIRTVVLTIHGALALITGMAFLYLGATMTNLFFDAVAAAIAILLSMAALILAAITDWFAAFSEGMKNVHRLAFYLIAGVALAITGLVLGFAPQVTMQWLLILAAIHALAFGISAFVSAAREKILSTRRSSMYLFGTISVLFSGVITAIAGSELDNPSAAAVLGTYLGFVGLKMLYVAWNLDRNVLAQEGPIGHRQHANILPL
jgi:MFS family permease